MSSTRPQKYVSRLLESQFLSSLVMFSFYVIFYLLFIYSLAFDL